MRLLVIGAGGHAKVVIEAAQAAGFAIAGVLGLPSDPPDVLGHPVSHSADAVAADAFIIAIGDNLIRYAHFDRALSTGLPAATVVHPSAIVSPTASIGEGSLVMPGAIVNACARVGRNVILNTGCVVEHDVVVGDHSLIGPLACLAGGSAVGEGVLVGAGSTLAPTRAVGAWSVCGAGAVVVTDLPEGMVCYGVPARPMAKAECPR